MAPVSIHFTLGVLAAGFVIPRMLKRSEDRRAAALGMVAGVVVVDLDLIVSSLSFLVTGTTATGKVIHRTLTHSYVVCAVVILVGWLLLRRASPRSRAWGVGLIAAAIGDVLFHITPDLFYLVDVKCFFPLDLIFTGHLVGVHIGDFRVENLSTLTNNLINGFDFASESVTWLFTWVLAMKLGTETRFTRMLPVLAAVNAVMYASITAIFAGRLSYDTFLIVIYAPGILNIALSCGLVPYLARDTWRAWGDRDAWRAERRARAAPRAP